TGFAQDLKPRMDLTLTITRPDGKTQDIALRCRIDTMSEVDYFRHGGVLQYVLRHLVKPA
ncbi:MAG: hypothetical protein ABL897_00745, partial [Hyphomicrobium sp.]